MAIIAYMSVIFCYVPGLMIIIKHRLFSRLPLQTVYYLSMFFFNVVGSLYVFVPGLMPISGYRLQELFTSTYYLLLVLQALIFYLFLFTFCPKVTLEREVPINTRDDVEYERIIGLGWFIISLVVSLYISRNGFPPLFNAGALLSGGTAIVEARHEATADNFNWYRFAFYTVPQLMTLFALLAYKKTRNRRLQACFIISGIVALVFAIMFLYKMPVIVFLGTVAYGLILYDAQISVKRLTVICILVICASLIFYYLYWPGRNILEQLNAIIWRIFGVYSVGLAGAIKMVNETGFFWGRTIINPQGILPYEVVELNVLTHKYLFGYFGRASVPAMGEAYVNFGWPGIFLFGLAINTALMVVQVSINRIFKSNKIVWVAITTSVASHVYSIATTSFFVFLSPSNIIMYTILVAALSHYLHRKQLSFGDKETPNENSLYVYRG